MCPLSNSPDKVLQLRGQSLPGSGNAGEGNQVDKSLTLFGDQGDAFLSAGGGEEIYEVEVELPGGCFQFSPLFGR